MTVATTSLRGLRIAHLIESDGPGDVERMVASLAGALQTRARRAHAQYTADRMVERYVALYAKRLRWTAGLAPGGADPPFEARQVAVVETAVGRERA